MESLRSDLIREILEYLDSHSIMQVACTCKRLNQIAWNDNFWAVYLQIPKPYPRYHSGPYYFYNISELRAKFYTKMNLAGKNKQFYWDCAHALNNLRPIIKKGIRSSSQDYDQGIENTLKYEDSLYGHYWSSTGSVTTDANEYLIYELIDTSIVASVHFMCYRAGFQGGVIYPPQKIQIKIGNSDNDSDYHYSSEIYDVEVRNKYFTVLVLPELVIGKYIKLKLIGKVSPQPGDEKYYTVLSYVQCIGYPLKSFYEESPLKALSSTSEEIEEISKIDSEYISTQAKQEPADPFIIYQLMAKNLLNEFIDEALKGRSLNPFESYFYVERALQNDTEIDFGKVSCYELIGDLLFEKGRFDEALGIYQDSRDFWKWTMVLVRLDNYQSVRRVVMMNDPRLPKIADVIKMAKELGEIYYQNAKNYFKIEN
ncbi:unnamed protein product [Blepharisma stoltei]|uniref:F-box domain-containing protein n=1 Tax=Blepharisma stoltei TaxID=1481888 RepID=A0AAU9JYR7_9CILI|nr:unnamed protein product [Blepharisma stoltei]